MEKIKDIRHIKPLGQGMTSLCGATYKFNDTHPNDIDCCPKCKEINSTIDLDATYDLIRNPTCKLKFLTA